MTLIRMVRRAMRRARNSTMEKINPCQRNRNARQPPRDPNGIDDVKQPPKRESPSTLSQYWEPHGMMEGKTPLRSSKIVVVTPGRYMTASQSVASTATIIPIFLGSREWTAYWMKNSS
jgi:hypothetical protein